jgi:prepilin-type N-terminal cleavage/methylation domain-containing protein
VVKGEISKMNKNRGFTIVELMIVIAIIAVAVALAVPSFRDLIERKAVSGAAEAAYEEIQLARAEALKRSKAILVDFNVNGTSWAIGVNDKMGGCNAEDTSGTGLCTVDYDNVAGTTDPVAIRIVGTDYKNITMSQDAAFTTPGALTGLCATTSGAQTCFDFVRGLARTGSYQFASANYTLQVEVGLLGRVHVCLPTGSKNMVGYSYNCTL